MYKIYIVIGGIKYAIVKPRLPTYTGDSKPAKARGLSPRTCEQSMHNHKESGHESKKEDKDQESIQLSTTPDPGYQWESDTFTIRLYKREPRGQPFPSR